jgi:hypothetical protein
MLFRVLLARWQNPYGQMICWMKIGLYSENEIYITKFVSLVCFAQSWLLIGVCLFLFSLLQVAFLVRG